MNVINREIIKARISEVVEEILRILRKLSRKYESLQDLFKIQPTINIYFLKDDLIGVSLIDEGQSELKCVLTQTPKKGKYYFYVSKIFLDDKRYNKKELASEIAYKIFEEAISQNAYTLNMERVEKLIKDGHYAVALVFLTSAFENATKDLFLNYNYLWFFSLEESDFTPLLDLLGLNVYDKLNLNKELSYREGSDFEQWENLKRKSYVFKLCKKLGVLNQYQMYLIANKMEEIGAYEILKQILYQALKNMRGKLNFQRIKEVGGVRWVFKHFFSIDTQPIDKELQTLQSVIEKRHKIIHAFLDDESITKTEVESTYDAVNKTINFLKDRINEFSLAVH